MKTPKFTFVKYRVVFAIIVFMVINASGYTQVNQEELENLPPVVFLNYEGPHARLDTREQIRQIGVGLGRQISSSEGFILPGLNDMFVERTRQNSYRIETGASNRYFIIHCISGQEDGKIDADIFGLGVDAGVDHIRNLRVIIQGYLQTTYNYNERDASLLAQYITVYNAVYRGSWDYFSNRYTPLVMENLVRDRAGLSIRYDEWPGRTLILIPLGHGGLSSIDTSTISDRRVVEELRKEDDQGVQQRQAMVDLKEREAEQAEQSARTERETIRQEERQNTQERQEIAQERQRVQEDQQAGRISQEESQQRNEELDRREQATEEKAQELEQRSEGVQRLEDFAEQKADEAQRDREDIAQDQQAAIVEETEGVLGVTIERLEPAIIGRLVRITLAGREIRRSPVDTVHARTVTLISGRILAIAGENRGNGAVRLIELNQNNLEIARQGDDDIMTGSLLWVNGSDIYAITADLGNNSCYLGRFNTNLALQAKSNVKVHPSASVTIQQGGLLTQREDGSVLLLNPADLTEIRQ